MKNQISDREFLEPKEDVKFKTICNVLSFDQWKTFSKNYKPIRVSSCGLFTKLPTDFRWLFAEFIRTQKRYPLSLGKTDILTEKQLI